LTNQDVLSYALYPNVYNEFKQFRVTLGQVGMLPTHIFLNPMKPGEEVEIEFEEGKDLLVRLVTIGDVNEDGFRKVVFEVNGEQWILPVTDLSDEGKRTVREKATDNGDVGAPMPGVVVGLKVHVGDKVVEGENVATLSAMKMESSIPATATGTVTRVLVNVGDKVEGDDLIMQIE
jgi:pyruvate carboxylase